MLHKRWRPKTCLFTFHFQFGENSEQRSVDLFEVHLEGLAQLADGAGVVRLQRTGHLQAAGVGAGAQHGGVVDAFGQGQALEDDAEGLAQQLVELGEQAAEVDLAAQVVLDACIQQPSREL